MSDPSNSGAKAPEEHQNNSDQQLSLWQEQPRQPATDSSITSARSLDYSQLPGELPQVADDPPWQLADLGGFVLFAVLTFLLANMGAAVVFFLLRSSMGWHLRFQDALLQTPFIVAMQVFWESLWFVFIYYTVTVKYQRPFWSAIRWWGRIRQSPYVYVVEGILLAAAAQGILNLLPAQKELPIERLFTSAAASYLLAFFGICVAPFIEELVFRGFFYPVFERKLGFWKAVLITAGLFAVIHGPQLNEGWPEMTAIFLVGVALSYTRGKTGLLAPSYLMHVAYNTSLFVALYFSTNRFHTLNG
jgi:CAAX protease family protein